MSSSAAPSWPPWACKALDYLNVESVGDTTYAVVGVDRDGCYRLFAPAWKKGQTAGTGDTIELLLDVRYR